MAIEQAIDQCHPATISMIKTVHLDHYNYSYYYMLKLFSLYIV